MRLELDKFFGIFAMRANASTSDVSKWLDISEAPHRQLVGISGLMANFDSSNLVNTLSLPSKNHNQPVVSESSATARVSERQNHNNLEKRR